MQAATQVLQRVIFAPGVQIVCARCAERSQSYREIWAVWGSEEGCYCTEYFTLPCGHFGSHYVRVEREDGQEAR